MARVEGHGASIAETASPEPAPEAPGAAELIDRLAAQPEVRDGELADGRHRVAYRELPALLDRLDRRFAAAGATPGEAPGAVAYECPQSVLGALGLLYLLSREYEVVLLPALDAAAKEAGSPRFLPSFCSHVVSARASAGDDPTAPLEVARHEAFAPDPTVSALPERGAGLYLRTSGSTGVPKLTRNLHRRWLANAYACVLRWRLTPDDRLAVPVPIFHSYGFGAAFLPGLLAGAAIDLGGGGNLLRYLEREERFAPNVAFLTPGLADAFLAVRKEPRRYRLAVTAGDKVKPETVVEFEERFGPLLDLYGSAEMGAVASPAPDEPLERRRGAAGPPLAGIALRIGPSGTLHCQQANGHTGYLVGAEDGGWGFEPHPDDVWFETGDLAEIDGGGFLRVLGRARLSVKRDGLLVVFADVEAALGAVPGVERAVVVAGGESRRGTRLTAVCRRAPGSALDGEAVRAAAFERLPRYAVPDAVVVVDELPHLASGKVDRRAVAELAAAAREASAAPPPGTESSGRRGTD